MLFASIISAAVIRANHESIPRPSDAAPGGMGGATRMHDPSEALHDRVRRGAMNIALVLIALLNVAQVHWIGVYGWEWPHALLLVIAAAPLGVGIEVDETRQFRAPWAWVLPASVWRLIKRFM
jgi:hypothetical protein